MTERGKHVTGRNMLPYMLSAILSLRTWRSGCQRLYSGSKVHYLLNGIRCDKLSMAVAAIKAHIYKHGKDSDAVLIHSSLTSKNLHWMWRLHPLVSLNLPSGRGPVLSMALSMEWLSWRSTLENSFVAQQQQLYELWHKAGLLKGRRSQKAVRL